MHTSNRFVETERVLKALANRRRLMIVKFLSSGHRDVGTIAEHIHLSFAATSRHLRVLANASLVETEQINTTVKYSLATTKHPSLVSTLKLL